MDIEKLASAGPEVVEAEFGQLAGTPSKDTKEKYIQYSRILKEQRLSKNDLCWRSFLTGYFGQQAGLYSADKNEQVHLFKQSLADYQLFQDTGRNNHPDTHYFAQWQIGSLQYSLRYEWSVAEESYLKAMEYEAERGEALREIIVYQSIQENWFVANIYSSYCMRQYLGKTPSKGKWFINTSFYQWKILKYQIPVLLHLGENEKAKECARKLFNLTVPNLNPAEIKEINALKESWGKLL